jgi:hypothetical protein
MAETLAHLTQDSQPWSSFANGAFPPPLGDWSLGPFPGHGPLTFPGLPSTFDPALVDPVLNPDFAGLFSPAEEMMRYAILLQLAADGGALTPPPMMPEEVKSPQSSAEDESLSIWQQLDLSDIRVLEAVHATYFEQARPCTGTTLMCHDLLNKFKVEPDLLQIFEALGVLDYVDYVYLPLTYLKTGTTQKVKKACRNKGYCFVHFSSEAVAQTFSEKVGAIVLPGASTSGKQIHSSLAKFQGIAANLAELIDIESPTWRSRTGYFHVRVGDKLERVGLSALRSFVEERTVR